jgi:hypothetical protein
VLRREKAGCSNWIIGDGIKVPKRGKKMPARGESAIGVRRFGPRIAMETYVVDRWREEPLKPLEDNIFGNNPFLDDLLEWRQGRLAHAHLTYICRLNRPKSKFILVRGGVSVQTRKHVQIKFDMLHGLLVDDGCRIGGRCRS